MKTSIVFTIAVIAAGMITINTRYECGSDRYNDPNVVVQVSR